MKKTKTVTATPLVRTQSTSSSESIRTVLSDYLAGDLFIPDYQRDSDQWDSSKKSLLIESTINNLTIPEFFICSCPGDDYDLREVVDGQQRLTTFYEYFSNQFALANSDQVNYFGDHSIHYAGKKFDELPRAFKKAFQNYKLSLTQLPYSLSPSLRLEIFRRINQQDSSLSPHDIRLSYYGDCETVTFIRLAGIYDKNRSGSTRMIDSAWKKYRMEWPWESHEKSNDYEWKQWWENKQTAVGQSASEMFLWYIIGKYCANLNDILTNKEYLSSKLKTSFSGKIDEVSDIACAQFLYESLNNSVSRLCNIDELKNELFPSFVTWFYKLRLTMQSAIVVPKYRRLAIIMSALSAYDPQKIYDSQIGLLEKLIRTPRKAISNFNIEIPESKGKWGGRKGQRSQIRKYFQTINKLMADCE